MRGCWAIFFLVPLLVGCSMSGGALRAPEAAETRAFQFLSAFYCKEKRWPQSWEEFATFSQPRDGGAALIKYFNSPKLSSPRAILLTVNYTNEQSSQRKVSFIAPPNCSQQSDMRVVSMAGGRVWFLLPEGFSVLGGQAIQDRWKRAPFPDAAWEDPIAQVVIALRFGEAEVPAGGLSAIKSELEAAYQSSVTDLKWLVRKVKKANGEEFLLHEYESSSVKGRLLTVSLTFAFDNRLLSVNIVGPKESRDSIEAVAERIHESFRLDGKETA